MKLKIITSLVILFFTTINASEVSGDLKVMTYNIWNGFDWGKDDLRKVNFINWVNTKQPDVLVLQELCGFDETKLLKMAQQWGHNYVKILKTDGYPVGITSKNKIDLKGRVTDGLWHGMLHCKTFGIDFFIVHLSPADVDIRYKEAQIITNRIKQSKSENYIILGDFNAHSPFDGDALKENTSLLKHYTNKDSKKKHSNLRLGEFDYSVMSKFLSLPAIDVCQKLVSTKQRYTAPTPAIIGIWQTAEEVNKNKERIDYILVSPNLAKLTTKAEIFNSKDTHFLSDHFPVMIEINKS